MVMFGWMLSALTLVGCGKDKETTNDTGDTVEPTCTVEISETVPAQDESFYYRGTIEVYFTEADDTATVTLTDASGAEVAGSTTWSDDATVLYFAPSSPLAASSNYTLAIDYCGGAPSVSFSTSELGAEASTADLNGKAYTIDLASARFIEPAGIGSLIGDLLEQNILVGVVDASDTSLSMIGAISVAGTTEQDTCTPSIDFPEADFSGNPFFSVGPEDTTIAVAGYSATIRGLEISGAFAPDLSYFGGGKLAGTIDSRDLLTIPDLLELTGCDGTVDSCLCDFISGTGLATCSACSDGTDLCLTLLADQIVAEEISGSLVVRTEAEVDADPECVE